jgi:hypothetical protein
MIRRSWTSYKIHPTIAFAMMSCVWLFSFESAWAQHQEPTDKPSWVSSGGHLGYPAPRYVQGVGQAKASGDPVMDRQAADQNAFAEIIQQITAEVSSVVSIEKIVVHDDKAETVFERASAGATIRSSLSVNGLAIAERYYDPQEKVYYSLGVVDRIAASDPYRQKLQRSKTDWQTYLKSAEEYKQQGKIFQAILGLREAYRAASQYQEILPSYQLLAGPKVSELETLDQQPEPSPAVILESFSAILANLRLQIDKGNGQAYILNKPLPSPLAVRLASGERASLPAEGFAVEFRFRSGQGDIFPMTVKTGNQGRALTSVSNIEPSSDEDYAVAATLDFAELLDTSPYRGDWNSRIPLNPVSILFTLKKKKAQATQISILIADKSAYRGKQSLMRNALASRLSQMGFKSVSNTSLDKTFASDEVASWEKLRNRVPKNIEIVILGEITDTSVSQAMGMVVCNLSGAVNAIEVKSGKVLSTRSMEAIRGFGTTEASARNDAYKNAGSEMAEALINDLLGGRGASDSH